MNEILLSSEVIVYLLSETVLYVLLFIAAVSTFAILRKWDFEQFTTEQFALENRSYLVMSIIFFVLLLKIGLLPYFVYTIDALSVLIPGAMCAAGVIDANGYGNPLLAVKIAILFLSGLWLAINHIDIGGNILTKRGDASSTTTLVFLVCQNRRLSVKPIYPLWVFLIVVDAISNCHLT